MIEAIKTFLCCILKEAGVWFLMVTKVLLSAECKPYMWDDIRGVAQLQGLYSFLMSLLAHELMLRCVAVDSTRLVTLFLSD